MCISQTNATVNCNRALTSVEIIGFVPGHNLHTMVLIQHVQSSFYETTTRWHTHQRSAVASWFDRVSFGIVF